MNKDNRLTRRSVLRASSALALGSFGMHGFAQQSTTDKWPDKPVRIVIAGPAGGSPDLVARALSDQLTRMTKHPFIVDAKPGGAGVIAINELLQAPVDPYTLLLGVSSLVSEIPHIVKMRYDTRKAIVPLVELARGGLVLVAAPNLAVKNVKDVIALSKADKDGLSYASYSPGTMSHVAGLLLNQTTGSRLAHVAYKGTTAGLNDVMGGHVPLMFDGLATSLPFIRSGKLKALGITSPQRSQLLPDVPTFAEQGLPQLSYTGWLGLWANSALPAEKQQTIRDVVLKATDTAEFKSVLINAGFEPGTHREPQALRAELLSDYDRVGAVLKGMDIKL